MRSIGKEIDTNAIRPARLAWLRRRRDCAGNHGRMARAAAAERDARRGEARWMPAGCPRIDREPRAAWKSPIPPRACRPMTPPVDPSPAPDSPDPSGALALSRLLLDPSAESLAQALRYARVRSGRQPRRCRHRRRARSSARRRGDCRRGCSARGSARFPACCPHFTLRRWQRSHRGTATPRARCGAICSSAHPTIASRATRSRSRSTKTATWRRR